MNASKGNKCIPHRLSRALAGSLIVAGIVFYAVRGFAQLAPPPLPNPWNNQICNWSFDDTTWYSDYGYAPVSFTNLDNPASFDGNALQVDSTNAAWLQYNIIEDDGFENLTFDQGTIELWVLPNWNSTTNDGTGPGDWGRLIDVGAYGTNAPSSWWSLYFTPDGNNLCFSSETNGVFTNYLNVPISWDSNTWHLVSLTYDQSQSQMYIDGQLATSGAGVKYLPSASVVSNGFFVGSDHTGMQQAHAQIDDLSTYNYVIWTAAITNDYAAGMDLISPPDSGGLMSGSFGGGGFGMDDSSDSSTDGNTNLLIAQLALASGYLTAIASNTLPGVQYEIQSLNDLKQTNWVSQGFIVGSATTNWTPLSPLAVDFTTNCFLRLRSWASSDGSGLPDWWELMYFGTTGIDPDAFDPSGDGMTIWQAYEAGANPNVFNIPPAPNNLAVQVNSGTSATATWTPSPGPVIGYTIGRWDSSLGQWQTFNISPTNQFVDTNFIQYPPWSGAISYVIEANYASGSTYYSSPVTALEKNTSAAQVYLGVGGATVLMDSAIPADASGIQVTRVDWNRYSSTPQIIGATNTFYVSAGLFTNSLYTIPTGQAGLGYDGSSWFVQTVWSNGAAGTESLANYAGYLAAQDYYNSLPGRFNDASTQLEQNVSFLLRAAPLASPFQFSYHGVASVQPTNYACASYWNVNDGSIVGGGLYYQAGVDWKLPFELNYLLRDFVYSSTNIDSSTGFLNTGMQGFYWPPQSQAYWLFNLQDPLSFVFPPTNTTTLPGLLSDQTTFTTPYFDWSYIGYYGFYQTEFANENEIGIANNYSQLYLTNNLYNYFGLKLLSVLVAHNHNSVLQLDTLTPGGSLPYTNDTYYYFYPQFDQPQLQTVGYYFAVNGNNIAPNGYDYLLGAPVPGSIWFSPTNAQPLMIGSVGTPINIAAFAKQKIINGNTNKPVYVSQYFDKAYKVDANGNVTSTQTGVLSPYGYFLPTEPGPVALVTLPSSDGQRGTGVVQVISLVLDANHDGNMDASLSGADYTTPSHAMPFWINDLYDQSGNGTTLDQTLQLNQNQGNYSTGKIQPNYTYGQIRCQRNLENFARLWIRGMPSLPTSQGYSVTLNVDWQSDDAVNLYQAYETNGGTGYLTDTNIAAAQAASPYGDELAQLASWNSDYVLPEDSQGNVEKTNFLFEGIYPGQAALELSVYQNGYLIAQSEAYVNLDEVKNYYEQAEVTNVVQTWPEMVQTNITSGFQVLASPAPDSYETKQLAVFVHGWRMTAWDTENFSDAMFKRLYWQGYQGRFASLRWPTRSADTDTNGMDLITFNRSEHIAFDSGSGAGLYLYNLRQRYTNYTISVCAHSQGNIVMMEALKELAAVNQSPVDNYVMMQAAVPAHCYDATVQNFQPFLDAESNIAPTPNSYSNYATGITNALRGDGRIINFYNPIDFALATATDNALGMNVSWEGNETLFKPLAFFGYGYISSNGVAFVTTNQFTAAFGITNLQARIVTDPLELMPFVARPRSLAAGAQSGVGQNVNGGELNLQTAVGFSDRDYDHSGEFNRNIQDAVIQQFYPNLISKLFPPQ